MNALSPKKSNSTPCLMARLSWQLWAVAIGIIILTHTFSFKATAETTALLMICCGFLLGVFMLATIPKYGAQGILKHALIGVALNGIMLAIAIPNFITARNAAMRKNEAVLQTLTNSTNWQQYQLAGLQLLSPVPLKPFSSPTDEVNSNLETYMGQLIPPGFTMMVHRRHLTSDDGYTLKNFTAEVVDLMKQKFPDGFQSSVQDRVTDGNPAKQISARWQKKDLVLKDSVLVIQKKPYIWQIQVMLPGEIPNADDLTQKVFDSIKILPQKT